jgi:CubicO group peptidase (beta-lactamase class C family)
MLWNIFENIEFLPKLGWYFLYLLARLLTIKTFNPIIKPLRMIKKILITLIFIYSGQISFAQNMGSQLDSLLNFMHNTYYFDGFALMADGNSVIYQKAYGMANRDWNIGNTIDTKFRIGSISKQFIGFVLIKLAEEDRLKLTDPVSQYIPEFNSTDKKSITILNLLTHTSGIFDYTDMADFNSMVLYPEDSLVKMISSHKLNFKPSDKYSYSNSNFYLLIVIAQKVSGKKFEDILAEKILTPAGMNNSGLEHNEYILPNRASPYKRIGSGFVNGEYIQMGNVAGGMYSTAGDMLRWSLFVQKQLAADKFLKETLQPFRLTNGTQSIYSCGWCLLPEKIMHQGHINGFANQISIDTINHHTVIILSNDGFRQLYVTGKIISLIMAGKENSFDYLMQKMPSRSLNEYAGVFILGRDTVVGKIENNTLIFYVNNTAFTLKPFLKDEFFIDSSEGNIKYERNNRNEVIGLFSFEDYNWTEWKKIR